MKISILTIWFFCIGKISVLDLDNVKMIVDVINSFNKPTAVVATICWTPGKYLSFK